jgi:glutamate/tyrosine decarboxylase-like PLP-dependent enzyme
MTFDLSDDELRRLGREAIEIVVSAVGAEQRDPVIRPIRGAAIRAMLDEPLPRSATPPDDLLAAWRDVVLPYCRHNGHPRFFGYVVTSADPLGVLADAVASAVNQPVTAWRSSPSAMEIERLVVRWLTELTGFGGAGHGLLVSGGSSANFHALACAVVAAEARAGLPAGSRHRLTVYLSAEGHVSLRKAARLLGVPPDQVRVVEVDDRRRMRVDDLTVRLAADRAAGLVPAAVLMSAGTANTGAIDPLEEIVDLAAREGVWTHVDGSYGAPAVLAADYAWMSRPFARADSLSLDPHKWLFVPCDAGCVLVRDEAATRRAFDASSEYIAVTQTDPIERFALFDHGLEMSRRFRGLKVWTVLKGRGADALAAAIQRDVDLRRQLDARVAADPRLEPLGSELSISCFRYRPAGIDEEAAIGRVNRTIVETLVAGGRCYMSPTTLDGRYALRACIVNFRTTSADIDFLIDEVLRIGDAAAGC